MNSEDLKPTAEQLKQMFVDDGHTNVTVVDVDPVDRIMEVAGFEGNILFQTHEVVALMQKAFDRGWDQTGATVARSVSARDMHVVQFLKEAMEANEQHQPN